MKGLVRNNFYSMESNIRVSFLIALFLVLVPVFQENDSIFQIILSMQIFLFIVNTGTALQVDEKSRWSRFERTLPVRKSDAVTARYLSFAALLLFGAMMGCLTVLVSALAGHPAGLLAVVRGFEFGLALSLFTAGFMYPLILKSGTEKSDMIMILSGIASIGIMVLLSALSALWIGEMNMKHPLTGAVSLAAALLVFAVSYRISIFIYSNKEF